ncbi:MAG: hypothetical protein U0797_10210 [Gemmataceae bacterium]
MTRACLVALAMPLLAAAEQPKHAVHLQESKGAVRVVVTGVPKADAVSVYVDRGARADQPAMLGASRVEGDSLVFEPRFPLVKGVRYRVVVTAAGQKTESVVSLPKPEGKPTTVVTKVYPTADKLPENQLKFYLHFSAPMAQGGVYKHISLLDAKGGKIDYPFLELEQELWDPEGKRFTLFFDPGRVKRGLKPREEMGPPLEEGKRYTLVIDRAWADAEGNPMRETFKKSFSVGPPDDTQPDVKTWELKPPPAGGREPLRVAFAKPMEHALAERLVWVADAAGEKVEGQVELSDRETGWSFTPSAAWTKGKYHLVADKRLEDLAGNSIGRPFEVDVLRPVERKIKTETVRVPFEVK